MPSVFAKKVSIVSVVFKSVYNNFLLKNHIYKTFLSPEKDGEMVQCCSNLCKRSWFHLDCVDLEESPEGDWFCSEDCRASGAYIYCLCHRRRGNEDQQMISCLRGENCSRHEKYHRHCIRAGPETLRGKASQKHL